MHSNEVNKETILKKVNELIELCNQTLKTKQQYYSGFHSGKHFVDKNLFAKCVTELNQFLNFHPELRSFLKEFTSIRPLAIHTNYDLIKKYLSLLEELKHTIETDGITFEKKPPKKTETPTEEYIANYYINPVNDFDKPIAVKKPESVFEAVAQVIENNPNFRNPNKLLDLLYVMEKSKNYKTAYVKHYKEFMDLTTSNIAELAQYIPELTRFLT